MTSPRTVETLSQRVIEQVAPEQLDELRVVAHGFFRSDQARDRIIDTVLIGRGGPAPAGVDAVSGTLIAQTALVLLQAVATDTTSVYKRQVAELGSALILRSGGSQETADLFLIKLLAELCPQAPERE